MNSSKILIATLLIILTSGLLSGCDMTNVNSISQNAVRIAQFKEVAKTVSLRAENEVSGSHVTVKLLLDNPEKKPLSSFQSWLSFNPDHLKGATIDTTKSVFNLSAPYTNGFDENQGIVQIGGATNKPSSEEVIQIAQIDFELKNDGVTMIDSYDYKEDLSGHLSANTLMDGTPYNLLKKPDSPFMVINQ